MSKGLNLKGDFSDRNFKIEFLRMAKMEIVQYNFHATRCQPVGRMLYLTQENLVYAISEQQRRRSACASAQSDQCLCCSLPR